MSRDNNSGQGSLDTREHPPTLPDFDTLRDLARNDPEGLERLRLALCERVINEAPEHAKPRLEGLMFQINSRRQLAQSDIEATETLSEMMNDSLQRMQAMLKDLRTVQSESILLTTRSDTQQMVSATREQTAAILPFRKKNN